MLFSKNTLGFGRLKQVSLLTVGLMTLLQVPVQTALAVSQTDRSSIYKNTVWYNNNSSLNCDTGGGSAVTGDPVARYIQVLARQESGTEDGNPRAYNPGGPAYGRYQYITSPSLDVWRGQAENYYPPAMQYANASLAPVAVQDALAYIQYSSIYFQFQDIYSTTDVDTLVFRMAVNHYYPAANRDESLLDLTPPGNSISIREYAERTVRNFNDPSYASQVVLNFTTAPEFNRYFQEEIGRPYSPNGNSGSSTSSECSLSPCSASSNTVVIDPGHSGTVQRITDPETGLIDYDYPNTPEIGDMFDVAQRVQTLLEGDGYDVLLTKSSANQTVSLRERAEIANQANAALAVSLHDQSNIAFADPSLALLFPQVVGLYRSVPATGERVEFTDAEVARLSQEYAANIKTAREAAEGRVVSIRNDAGAYIGTRLPSGGNIWMVQLFSKVPWVYSEVGGNSGGGGLNDADKQKYATGVANGIKASLPLSGGTGGQTTTGTGGCTGVEAILRTIELYAWSDNRGDVYCPQKPEYTTAMGRPGAYNGSPCGTDSSILGVDCGAFVTAVMRDSGVDPDYNNGQGNTVAQWEYLRNNPQKYREVPVNQLQPGDIGVNDGHTHFFVGNGIPGWGGNMASASQYDRSPMARSASPGYLAEFTWYRVIQ